mmetsp:Transcript_53752/g.73690  ORF Transcript_53752/g.73690 Transcript_53752/m.73690 type:complete len:439 (-) Transcript_53752:73-1389(-)
MSSGNANDAFPAHYGALRKRGENGAAPQAAKAEAAEPEVVGASTVSATVVNVTKGIIGSGMLALPVALGDASVLPGMICLALFAGVSAFSYALIGYCCAATGEKTFHGLWTCTVGSSSTWAVQFCIILDTAFTLWAYSTLVADFLGKACLSLFPAVEILQSRALMLGVIGTVFFAPLSFSRTIDALKYTSALGLLATLYSLFYVCGDYAVSGEGAQHFAENMFEVRLVIFKSIGLFAFSFMTHYAAPHVNTELENKDPKRWCVVTGASFTASFLIYAGFMLCGYGRWGQAVEGNVLKNYGEGSRAVLLMWVAMALSVMFSYPLIFATFKENLYGMMGTDERSASVGSRVLIVVLGVYSSVFLGTVFDDASLVMGICGAIVSSAIMFIFPALIYLYLPPAACKGYAGKAPLRAASYALICVGILASVIGTGATIADAME